MTAFEGKVMVVITRNYLHTCTWICKLTDVLTHTHTHTHTHTRRHAPTHTHTHTHLWVYFFVNALKMFAFNSFLNSNICLDQQGKERNFKMVVIFVTFVTI